MCRERFIQGTTLPLYPHVGQHCPYIHHRNNIALASIRGKTSPSHQYEGQHCPQLRLKDNTALTSIQKTTSPSLPTGREMAHAYPRDNHALTSISGITPTSHLSERRRRPQTQCTFAGSTSFVQQVSASVCNLEQTFSNLADYKLFCFKSAELHVHILCTCTRHTQTVHPLKSQAFLDNMFFCQFTTMQSRLY